MELIVLESKQTITDQESQLKRELAKEWSCSYRSGYLLKKLELLLEHQSDFQVLESFKLPRENGVIIAIKQLRYTILTAVSLYIGRNTQFHIPNAFASLFHG